MTDLLSRPRTSDSGTDGERLRTLPVAGAVAGAAGAGLTLLLCMAIALIGWFLADAGAHGQTTDALRIGADAWLLGQGAHLTVAGSPIGITPLALTAALVLGVFRCGRWAARTATPPPDDRTVGVAAAVCAGVYVVVAVLVAELAGRGDASASIPRTVLGALLVAGCAGGLGLAAGSGRLEAWWADVPGHARSIAEGALTGVAFVLAAGAALVAVGLAMSFNEAASVFSSLDLSFGDGLMLLLVSALVAPNAALFGVGWLAGPGFAVGTGTSVTATAVHLGPVPAFPLLAALPGDGAPPGWFAVLLAIPALCAAAGAGLAQHRYDVPTWDSAALRGFGAGFGAGMLGWLLVCLSGGPMGTGRMADIGAPAGAVLVTLVGGMSIGGLLGGLAVALWQGRRDADEPIAVFQTVDEAEADQADEADEDDTVQVDLTETDADPDQ